jgi:hypothetical protein
MALTRDGTVTSWPDSTPAGISNVVAIAAGAMHALALGRDGRVFGWGDSSYGQLNVPADLTNAVAISAGGWHSMALQADGKVIAWGDDQEGESTLPEGLTNGTAIAAGYWHGVALVGEGPPPLPVLMTPEPRLLGPEWTAAGFSLTMQSEVGRVYLVEFKDSLGDSNWMALPMVVGDGRIKTVTDPAAADSPQRFYRVRHW